MRGEASRSVAACLVGATILAVVASGCGPLTTVRRVDPSVAARAEGCTFDVVNARPDHEYRVVGVIDVEAFSVRKVPNDECGFRAAVAKDVCKLGGDGVIPGIDADGRYVLATVLAWIPDEAAPSEHQAPPPVPEGAP